MTGDRRVSDRGSHPVAECAQAGVIFSQGETLARVDASLGRVAIALEELARRGAQVDNHEKRLDKNDEEHDEIFQRIREIERTKYLEEGENAVENKRKKFWSDAKIALIQPLAVVAFFFFWLMERFGVLGWLVDQFNVMGGK